MDDAEVLALRGATLTIGDLLRTWGFRVRDDESVPVINRHLTAVGLTTEPGFARGPLGTRVRVVPAERAAPPPPDRRRPVEDTPRGPSAAQDEAAGQDEAAAQDEAVADPPLVSMKVNHLPAATRGVRSVPSGASLEHVITLMLERDFSQIPVIDGTFALRGAVSWRSIATTHATGRSRVLENAIEREVETVHLHDDLMKTLPKVTEHEYVLVQDQGRFCGIVTTADIVNEYDRVARPYFLVGEIERRLRRCLTPRFALADVRAVAPKANGVHQLTFYQYQQLLNNEQRWRKLRWTLDREAFVEGLDRVRRIRNQIMHFHVTPVTEAEMEHLRRFGGMLRLIDPS
jgi:CBS domain-containing protein